MMSFKGDLSQLNDSDRFMAMLVQVPGWVFLSWFKACERPISVPRKFCGKIFICQPLIQPGFSWKAANNSVTFIYFQV